MGVPRTQRKQQETLGKNGGYYKNSRRSSAKEKSKRFSIYYKKKRGSRSCVVGKGCFGFREGPGERGTLQPGTKVPQPGIPKSMYKLRLKRFFYAVASI